MEPPLQRRRVSKSELEILSNNLQRLLIKGQQDVVYHTIQYLDIISIYLLCQTSERFKRFCETYNGIGIWQPLVFQYAKNNEQLQRNIADLPEKPNWLWVALSYHVLQTFRAAEYKENRNTLFAVEMFKGPFSGRFYLHYVKSKTPNSEQERLTITDWDSANGFRNLSTEGRTDFILLIAEIVNIFGVQAGRSLAYWVNDFDKLIPFVYRLLSVGFTLKERITGKHDHEQNPRFLGGPDIIEIRCAICDKISELKDPIKEIPFCSTKCQAQYYHKDIRK